MILIEERTTRKCPGTTSLFITSPYIPELVSLYPRLENCIYHKADKVWEMPISKLSEFIEEACLLDNIELHILPDETNVNTVAYNEPEGKTKLFQHQLEGVEYGLNHDRWLLLDAPGLGKTLTIIRIAEELYSQGKIEHCLIVCGINTLKENWKKEIEKHSFLDSVIIGQHISRTGTIYALPVKDRVQQLLAHIQEFFVIVNIETLRDDSAINAINKGTNNFDLIVIDEIHKAKSSESQQGKNLLKLDKALYKIGATGTVLLNNPLDTYMPLKWIGAERATLSQFRYYYCRYGGQFNNTLIGFKNIEYLKDQLSKHSLRRTKELLNLPPKTIIEELVEMYPPQAEFYDNIKQGIIEQVDKVHISTASLLAMVTRLRQATALPSILTSSKIKSAKVERALDLTEEILSNNEKVVIFSTFKEVVYELSRQLQAGGCNHVVCTGDIDDTLISQNIDKFQTDPSCKVFVGTWQKCGTGITLTAATYMIFIDTPYTAGEFEQVCDRIHRIGTKVPVTIYNLITRGTFDERVRDIVNDKSALSQYVVDNELSEAGLISLRKYIEDLK